MAGVHPLNFWFSNLCWDMVLLTCVNVILCILLYMIDTRLILTTNDAIVALFLLNFMFGLGGILMAYVFSFATKSAPSSFSLFVIFCLVTGVMTPIAVYFMDQAR